ncbi:MAG: carboxylesterase family protein, partial [Pseudomonadota bacterium]
AGGFAVSTLLASPKAPGLFRGAIPQSGGAQHTLPKAAGELCAERFMAEAGADTEEALLALSAEAVLAAQNTVAAEIGDDRRTVELFGVSVSPFYPVEGNAVVPESPLAAIAAGAGKEVAVLTGSNGDETTLWGYGEVDDGKLERFAATYGATDTLAVYRRTRPAATPEELLIALTTDHMFRMPAVRLLEARLAAGAEGRGWLYQFNWRSRAFEGRLGATHALEIPFAFDNLDKPGVDLFLGPGDRPQHVADAMHSAWTAFVRDLDPGWAPYDLTTRTTMVFNDESAPVADPGAEERQAWAGIR